MKIIDRKFLKSDTLSCHAATVSNYKDDCVFAWFGGFQEGSPEVSIYIQFKNDIYSFKNTIGVPHWNPILFTIGEDLFISYKVGVFCDRWQTFVLKITNFELDTNILNNHIKKSQIIPAGLNFCTKTKPIITNNYLICGSSVETLFDWTSYIECYSYDAIKSEFVFDSRSSPIQLPKVEFYNKFTSFNPGMTLGIIQPSIWSTNGFDINVFMRSSRGLGKIYYAASYNETDFGNAVATRFDNPNSGIDTLYKNDRLFLVYNPSQQNRYPLLLVELDEKFNIIDEIAINDEKIELSYPYLISGNDNKIHLVYTYGRKKIEHCTIES